MLRIDSPRRFLTLLSLLVVLAALRSNADQLVDVTFFSLSPNPVYIVTGEAVYWTDADGGGPYQIFGNAGWSTVTDGPGVQFLSTGTYGYYDDAGDSGTIYVTANVPPSVSITNPANHAVLSAPANFTFAATASDTDHDGLSDVEFYIGTNLVDDVFFAPYETLVTNLSAGNYTLTAKAWDNVGASTSSSISISVLAAQPPILLANRSGNKLVIRWDTNNAAGLFLQSSTNMALSSAWTPVTDTPVPVGSQLVVTNPIVGARKFFRLSNLRRVWRCLLGFLMECLAGWRHEWLMPFQKAQRVEIGQHGPGASLSSCYFVIPWARVPSRGGRGIPHERFTGR
jgi:hypothetical protein